VESPPPLDTTEFAVEAAEFESSSILVDLGGGGGSKAVLLTWLSVVSMLFSACNTQVNVQIWF
jgi:hypothetical protein